MKIRKFKINKKSAVIVFTLALALTGLTLQLNSLAYIQRDTDAVWYLAEGTTAWGFSTRITIGNPNPESVTARITYMGTTGQGGQDGMAGRYVDLPPYSQTTVDPREDLGEADFSTTVTGSKGLPITVERTMSWNGEESASGEAHSAMGVTGPSAPAKTWYLPEGCSAWGFETWTLVQNPNADEANVELTYMLEDGAFINFTRKIPAYSRATYSMQDDIGQLDASIQVTSDVAVIAERSMYRNDRREGSCSMGATTPTTDYYLAEGCTGWGFTTYVLIQNPQEVPSDVTVTYQSQEGPVAGPTFQMPPRSRKTINVNGTTEIPGLDPSFSTQVHGSAPIVTERAMYWDSGQGEACHASIGVPQASHSFLLPDGQTSEGYETYTLVQNPGDDDVEIDVTYLLEGGGTPVTFAETVPANSRRTYSMADKVANGRASVLVSVNGGEESVIVEHSIYWNNRGAGVDSVGSGGEGTRNWPKPVAGSAYLSQDYSMPHSQNAYELGRWLASEHFEYDIDGWFFFGSLIDDARPDDPGGFFVSTQRVKQPDAFGIYRDNMASAFAFHPLDTADSQYLYGGLYTTPEHVKVESDPEAWRVRVFDNPGGQLQPVINMSLENGLMGQPGAVYRFITDRVDSTGKRLQADVVACDRMGAVNHGYGTTSFFPNFINPTQWQEINGPYGGSVQAYLEDTGDPMYNQGEYYYSFPLMDVLSFTIWQDGAVLSQGTPAPGKTCGVLWTDCVVDSLDRQTAEGIIGSKYFFYSIMFPELDQAMLIMVTPDNYGNKVMQARLYSTDSDTTLNLARLPIYVWKSNEVEVLDVAGSEWTSPVTGEIYFMEHRIRLTSPGMSADLEVKMIRDDQEIVLAPGESDYEGLGWVKGVLNGQYVEGTTFTELVNDSSHL